MNKYALIGVCLLAALGALLLEVRATPAAAPQQLSASQLDSYTSKLLPAEFRNTNVSMGKSVGLLLAKSMTDLSLIPRR